MRMLHGTSHNWHLPRNCPLLKNTSSSSNMPCSLSRGSPHQMTGPWGVQGPAPCLNSGQLWRAISGSEAHMQKINYIIVQLTLLKILLCSFSYRCLKTTTPPPTNSINLCALSDLLTCSHSSLSISSFSGMLNDAGSPSTFPALE